MGDLLNINLCFTKTDYVAPHAPTPQHASPNPTFRTLLIRQLEEEGELGNGVAVSNAVGLVRGRVVEVRQVLQELLHRLLPVLLGGIVERQIPLLEIELDFGDVVPERPYRLHLPSIVGGHCEVFLERVEQLVSVVLPVRIGMRLLQRHLERPCAAHGNVEGRSVAHIAIEHLGGRFVDAWRGFAHDAMQLGEQANEHGGQRCLHDCCTARVELCKRIWKVGCAERRREYLDEGEDKF
ncbi:hypothetical protein BDY17DRAFT_59823 [Neohortaea acidophila]|uniref:Uncharacterized protein n=1 Tax=Neohortaea acidophila TaxID=245834 RepID=A0A6A6PFT6_9PEZI|nr:uncharacterized protein BDY17DRAFT_59823 [Neohortaea acidophila]KAF2478822.1 hypothetical protein BDY17DRAFT_59823 [Neohortaea acidophila]